MTEITAPPVGAVVGGPPRPPTARVSPHDHHVDAGTTPGAAEAAAGDANHAWAAHLLDATGAAVAATAVSSAGIGPDPLITAVLVAAWVGLMLAGSSAVLHPLSSGGSRSRAVLKAGAVLAVLCWLVAPVFGTAVDPARTVPLVGGLVVAGLLARTIAPRRRTPLPLVVAGHPEDLRPVLAELGRSGRHRPVAACVTHDPAEPLAVPLVHAGVTDAAQVAVARGADAVLVVPGPHVTAAALRHLGWDAEQAGTHVYVGTGLVDVAPWRTGQARAGGLGLLHVRPSRRKGPRSAIKAAVERTAAASALLVLSPLLTLLWALIRLDSPGKAIFRQERVGRDGTTFTMLKFRTMRCTAEAEKTALQDVNEGGEVLFKMREDPRITRVGALLRRYSLDELPQLWNIVRGDMALVGPRPALADEVAKYSMDAERRLVVKPGLTGLWQVSGRSDLSWAETVRLDTDYVDNWSLARDAGLVCRTFEAVASHRGAY
jgi:exopolysaccharide biosynthesis polyprenyl glycosylphosphotransferase